MDIVVTNSSLRATRNQSDFYNISGGSRKPTDGIDISNNGGITTNTSKFVLYILNIAHDVGDYEDYHYDANASYLPLGEVIPVGMIYGLTFLLGFIGNFLVIFSIARFKRMRNITNTFLLSLATADLLLVTVCVPIKGVRFFTFTWTVGTFLCKYVSYMQNVSMICSVMTLTIMSIERYIAILYPLRAKSICTWRHAISVVVVIWFASFVLGLPILFGQKMVSVGVDEDHYWCIKEWSGPFGVVYELYMLLLMFICPVCVMLVAYTSICRELWRMMSHRATLRATHDRNHYQTTSLNTVSPTTRPPFIRRKTAACEDDMTRKQVVYMLVVIVGLFALCWGPILINNLLVSLDLIHEFHYGELKPMRQAFFLMSYFNSCVNPIVYGFMSRNFRRAFRQALCSCVPASGTHNRQWSLRTRTSALTTVYSTKRADNHEIHEFTLGCRPDGGMTTPG